MEHPESDYVARVLGEPLKDALSAVVLYRPLDPIYFIANYLKYWAVKVRDYRRRKAALVEMERILSIEIPWNLQVQAEKAIRLEQDYLKGERIRVEEEEKRRVAELKRVRELTETKATQAMEKLRRDASSVTMEELCELAADLAFHAWERAELERIKAEKAAERARRRAEMGEDDLDEEEEEEED